LRTAKKSSAPKAPSPAPSGAEELKEAKRVVEEYVRKVLALRRKLDADLVKVNSSSMTTRFEKQNRDDLARWAGKEEAEKVPLNGSEREREARERARVLAQRLTGTTPGVPERIASLLGPGSDEPLDEDLFRALLAEIASAGLLRYVVPDPFGGHGPQVEVRL